MFRRKKGELKPELKPGLEILYNGRPHKVKTLRTLKINELRTPNPDGLTVALKYIGETVSVELEVVED